MDDALRQKIAFAVEAAMHAFEDAERACDAERLIAQFAAVPGFHMYNDGQRISYEEMAAGVRSTFPTLRAIDGGFDNIEVMVLAPDAALASATFREVVTDAAGAVTRLRGTASWIWRLFDGDWRIVYGQADHYPDGE